MRISFPVKSAEVPRAFAPTLPRASRADFIAKLEISLKETNETSKWLEMLWKSDYIDEARYKALSRKCSTIRFLLVKSVTTAKNNLAAKSGKPQ